jgi:hypothetical protein
MSRPRVAIIWGGHYSHKTTATVYDMYTHTMPKVLASVLGLLASLYVVGVSCRPATAIELEPASAVSSSSYGVDCSFPVFDHDLTECGGILGDRQTFYETFVQGCRDKFGTQAHRCDSTEQDRLEMSRRQPQSMVVSVLL